MKRVYWILYIVFFLSSSVVFAKQRVAVLEFRSVGMDRYHQHKLSDEARGGIREGLPIQGVDVHRNMKQVANMEPGISDCDTECEVTIGQIIGANYVLSGSVYEVENTYILTLNYIMIRPQARAFSRTD